MHETSLCILKKMLLLLCLVQMPFKLEGSEQKARNVIFFIIDGMGPASITGTRIWAKGSSGKLALDTMPHLGLANTYSSSNFVTDSAAAATALASGVKTYNGAIGYTDPKFDPSERSRKVETLIDLAHKKGMKTGIITTTRVTHATPASFYAHAASRDYEEEIAEHLLDSPLSLLLGGGRKIFNKQTNTTKNTPPLLQRLKNNNWQLVKNKQALLSLANNSDKRILGLFQDNHMSYELERNTSEEPSLKEMLAFALNYFKKSGQPYFLVVEGGKADLAAHNNNAKKHFSEILAADEALNYARKNSSSDDTLIVVTADHETGGLAISGYMERTKAKGEALLKKVPNFIGAKRSYITWATGPNAEEEQQNKQQPQKSAYHLAVAAHTAVDVLVLASGPGSELFNGYMNNIEIPWNIAKIMGSSFTEQANIDNHRSH